MSTDLIDMVNTVFTEDVYDQLAQLSNEPKQDIQRAVQVGIPVVLTGILRRTEDPDGAFFLYSASRQAAAFDPYGHLQVVCAGPGGEFLKAILGERVEAVTAALAQQTGISGDTAGLVLRLTTLAALDSLGTHRLHADLDPRGLNDWLWAQRDAIIYALPEGLDMTAALGTQVLPGSDKNAQARRGSLVFGLIALALLLGIIFFIFRTCSTPPSGA
jgi:hypothetical protein